jgi:nitroimidazol reductase NimA-like FMN-containing flavoprotein (pyridoxamine 5'-phosphate oxidase superfamily)
MLGVVSTYTNDEHASIYLHGSSVARLFKMTANGEIPVCICGTILDGYVLALAPFHNSCNYRSAVVFGYGSVVTDTDEILFALREIVNNSNPKRWENSRSPPTKAELNSTGVIKVRIETASAKTRTGGPHDDKADLNNAALASNCWTGVVPTYQVLGDPVADEHNKMSVLPEYMSDWVADTNAINEQRAIDALDG